MIKKKPGVDVIQDILKETQKAHPSSKFIESLLFQYEERGGLSKRQLEGLYDKASRIETIPPGKLATLEAIILKKVTRYKSPAHVVKEEAKEEDNSKEIIDAILEKYPQHKRVLFYKAKLENGEPFSAPEKTELEKFKNLLLK